MRNRFIPLWILIVAFLALLFVPIPFRYGVVLCIPCPPNLEPNQCPKCPMEGQIGLGPSLAKRLWNKITAPEADRSEQTEQITPPQGDTTSYVCPKNNHIDCMPIVHPSRAYQCEKDYLEWAKNNCPGLIITY